MIFRCVRVTSFVLAALLAPTLWAQESSRVGTKPGGESSVKDPRSRAKIHTELGSLYFQDRNVPVAMEELTVALYIDPTYAPAYSMRALVHHYLKETQYAEDNFRDALRYGPDDPDIANNYGWFLCQIGKYREGLPQFERAVRNRLYQTPERAYMNAGQCAMLAGDMRLAEDYLDKASRFSSGNPGVMLRLVELYYRTGRMQQASTTLAELNRLVEPNAEVLWLGIRVARKLGERETEAKFAVQLRRNFPTSNEYQELLKGNY